MAALLHRSFKCMFCEKAKSMKQIHILLFASISLIIQDTGIAQINLKFL